MCLLSCSEWPFTVCLMWMLPALMCSERAPRQDSLPILVDLRKLSDAFQEAFYRKNVSDWCMVRHVIRNWTVHYHCFRRQASLPELTFSFPVEARACMSYSLSAQLCLEWNVGDKPQVIRKRLSGSTGFAFHCKSTPQICISNFNEMGWPPIVETQILSICMGEGVRLNVTKSPPPFPSPSVLLLQW